MDQWKKIVPLVDVTVLAVQGWIVARFPGFEVDAGVSQAGETNADRKWRSQAENGAQIGSGVDANRK